MGLFIMTTVIIACHTLMDELNMVIKETKSDFPVLWIESGLHLYPDSLNKRLQEELNRLGDGISEGCGKISMQ